MKEIIKSTTKKNENFYIYKEIKIKISKDRQLTKIYKCPDKNCGRFYRHRNKMIAHLRTHYGIKPFTCHFCQKKFNENGNLKTHLRIHTGERPYKCDKCSKSFKAFGQLKDHLSSHTGYKPFQCPICKKFYRRKGILKNHLIIHKLDLSISIQEFSELINSTSKNNFDNVNSQIDFQKNNFLQDSSNQSTFSLSFSETNKNNQDNFGEEIISQKQANENDVFYMLEKDLLQKNVNCLNFVHFNEYVLDDQDIDIYKNQTKEYYHMFEQTFNEF